MIGWQFPSNGGGQVRGIADAGIQTFTGKEISSPAREICQNSLDAVNAENFPVTVKFYSHEIFSREVPACDDYKNFLSKCRDFWSNNIKARDFFDAAIRQLKRPKISVLRISDFNTTGLAKPFDSDAQNGWNTLTKIDGGATKTGDAAGNVTDKGKNSAIRTLGGSRKRKTKETHTGEKNSDGRDNILNPVGRAVVCNKIRVMKIGGQKYRLIVKVDQKISSGQIEIFALGEDNSREKLFVTQANSIDTNITARASGDKISFKNLRGGKDAKINFELADEIPRYPFTSNPNILNGVVKFFKHFNDEKTSLGALKETLQPAMSELNKVGGAVVLDCLTEDEIAAIMIAHVEKIFARRNIIKDTKPKTEGKKFLRRLNHMTREPLKKTASLPLFRLTTATFEFKSFCV